MSIELVVLLRGRVLARSDFARSPIRIGRSPENEIFIDNLGLSRNHAVLSREGSIWTLEDQPGSSGTFVNGKRIARWHLADGDRIGVGKFTIVFHGREASAHVARAARGGTAAIRKPEETPQELETASPIQGRFVLADGTERSIALDASAIGSDPSSLVPVKGWLVPAHVALVARTITGFCVVNVAGGSWVLRNGKPVEWEVWLADHDVLRFGRTEVTFRVGANTFAETRRETPCRT